MNVMHELRELDYYLEGMEDIDVNYGPNVAMRVRQLLNDAIPILAELVEADKEYDAANVAWDELDTRDGIGEYKDPRDYEGPEYMRMCKAISRRATAIASMQEGAK